jgi:hypothetical protein
MRIHTDVSLAEDAAVDRNVPRDLAIAPNR